MIGENFIVQHAEFSRAQCKKFSLKIPYRYREYNFGKEVAFIIH